MIFLTLYAFHFAAKHVDGVYGQNVKFWSDYSTLFLSEFHWQIQTQLLFCVLCKSQPFKRVCWYGGAIL